jgi:uncharacterized protein YxjI
MVNENLVPISPAHAVSENTELYLKEKSFSWTGDDAKIKDSKGTVVFKIKAKYVSFSQRRILYDGATGKELAQLRHKKMELVPTIYIGIPGNDKKVKLKTKGMFNPFNCDAGIHVNGREVGEVKGNWRAKHFHITIDGAQVAYIRRRRTAESVFLDADSYEIAAMPKGDPVDMAFICLICVAMDELYHDK